MIGVLSETEELLLYHSWFFIFLHMSDPLMILRLGLSIDEMLELLTRDKNMTFSCPV